MHLFETLLIFLLGATVMSAIAKRLNVPYPTVLAVGGGIVAFIPGTPRLDLPPDLILAVFVAPVLVDAAFDTSLRDLRRNWPPILSLVLGAVALTTVTVALTVRLIFPEFPWAAAIALGALVAPPDAVAALAILKHANPPHRIRMVLEGESLLNDASALLIYRLAVGAVAASSFSVTDAVPTFAVVVMGSVIAGWLLAWPTALLLGRITDAPSFVIAQFVVTFGVWLAAERLGLSGVVTIVVYGITMAQRVSASTSAHLRVPSFAIWETVTFVLNVLAFTLIGLQLRPTLEALESSERMRYLLASLLILATVIITRVAWVMTHQALVLWKNRIFRRTAAQSFIPPPTIRGGLVIAWSGMRGIVTLAAAMALPASFPYHDFIQLAAFVVVLGTLVIQGLSLRPLLLLFGLPKDTTVQSEVRYARKIALTAALSTLDGNVTPAAQSLRQEYEEALSHARSGQNPRNRPANVLRQQAVIAARGAIEELRAVDTIGDDAYRRIEEELDWLELSSRPGQSP
jgi:CPA1 family monovalent cation:H+ antiporter